MTAAATEQKTAKFASRGRNYQAILLNPVTGYHQVTGDKLDVQHGFVAEFARHPGDPVPDDSDGTFTWPPEPGSRYDHLGEPGESGFPVFVDPITKHEVDVVKRLREHEHFNVQFVELGPSPAELEAAQSEVLKEITRCAVTGDLERLAEIYDDEETGAKRGPVLEQALEAMRAVEEAQAAEREPAAG